MARKFISILLALVLPLLAGGCFYSTVAGFEHPAYNVVAPPPPVVVQPAPMVVAVPQPVVVAPAVYYGYDSYHVGYSGCPRRILRQKSALLRPGDLHPFARLRLAGLLVSGRRRPCNPDFHRADTTSGGAFSGVRRLPAPCPCFRLHEFPKDITLRIRQNVVQQELLGRVGGDAPVRGRASDRFTWS
jgi:hypothetical protein